MGFVSPSSSLLKPIKKVWSVFKHRIRRSFWHLMDNLALNQNSLSYVSLFFLGSGSENYALILSIWERSIFNLWSRSSQILYFNEISDDSFLPNEYTLLQLESLFFVLRISTFIIIATHYFSFFCFFWKASSCRINEERYTKKTLLLGSSAPGLSRTVLSFCSVIITDLGYFF